MSSDEEYLDELLKSMVEDENESDRTNSALDDLTNENPIDEASADENDWGEIGSVVSADDNMTDFAIEDFGVEDNGIESNGIQDAGMEDNSSAGFEAGNSGAEELSDDFLTESFGMEEAPADYEIDGTAAPAEEVIDLQSESPGTKEETSDDFAIEDFGGEEETSDDFAIEDFGGEEEISDDFAIEDFGGEEETSSDFAVEDFGTEEASNDFAIEDFGAEEEASGDFAIEDFGGEEEASGDFAIEDFGGDEEASGDFAIEDFEGGEEASGDFAIEDFGGGEEASGDFAMENYGSEGESAADFGSGDTGAGDTAGMSVSEEEPVDDFAIEDFGVVEPDEGELAALEESQFTENDVDAMFAAANEVAQNEPQEIEINSEEDMLALLDSMSNEIEAEQAAAEQAALAEAKAAPENGEEEGGKKKKKKLFGRKKKDAGEQNDNVEETGEEPLEEPARPPGLFSKLLSFLTETDEEEEDTLKEGLEPSDENKSILEELDKEDKKKKKKKEKGKKGKGDEGGEESPEEGKKEKKKKEKKEKKEKKKDKAAADALETAPERPPKRVSKKSVAVIAGLGLTLTAMVIVLCSIVPAFFDKQEARTAYYNADYKKSFELLYGKKLDESDTIIYNQSLTIMEITRKLDAYHNYLAIGEEVRALDALMMGVQKYPDTLLKAEEFHVTQEVNAVYETMLNILNDKYGISENEAGVIIAYDDVTYTRRLESAVNGTPFADPNAEVQVSADVLPEEQDFYESTPENVLGADTDSGEDISQDVQADVPEEDQGETSGEEGTSESTEGQTREAEGIEADNVLGENMDSESSYIPEEPAPEENSADSYTPAPEETTPAGGENADTSSGSQGKMIQGVRQPLDVQIHGN